MMMMTMPSNLSNLPLLPNDEYNERVNSMKINTDTISSQVEIQNSHRAIMRPTGPVTPLAVYAGPSTTKLTGGHR